MVSDASDRKGPGLYEIMRTSVAWQAAMHAALQSIADAALGYSEAPSPEGRRKIAHAASWLVALTIDEGEGDGVVVLQ